LVLFGNREQLSAYLFDWLGFRHAAELVSLALVVCCSFLGRL